MVIPRAVALSRGVSRTILRRAGSSARSRSWKQTGRRGYASDHGHANQQSSEIPWIIGSVAVTVPAAAWLLQQGPKKGGHSHEEHHDEKHAEAEEGDEEKTEEQPDEEEEEGSEGETKDTTEDEPKEEKTEGGEEKDEGEGEGESDKSGEKDGEASSEDEYEAPGPNAPKQINWTSASKKGPGEGQKGEREPSETKGEKDSASNTSGAKHPYLDDPEKSKKGAGPTETAKIHGTVDSKGPAR